MQTEAIWEMPNLEVVNGMPPQSTTGSLSIDATGINLSTSGYFINNLVDGIYVPVVEPPPEQLELITSRGHAPDYLPITLYRPKYINGKMFPLKGASYPNGMEISTEWAFVGGYYANIEALRFTSIYVQFSLLDLWLNKIQVEASPSSSYSVSLIGEAVQYKVEFQPTAPFPLYKSADHEITAEIRAFVSGIERRNLWSASGYSVTQQPYIHIQFAAPATIEATYSLIQKVKLFLSVCLRRNVTVRAIHGSSAGQSMVPPIVKTNFGRN